MNRRQFARGSLLLVMITLCVLLAAAAQSPQPSTSTLLTGLVAYWNMEEASGLTRQDAGSNNLDLTDNNTVAQASGKIGYAAQFSSGGTDYLSHDDDALLEPGSGDFTLALWVNLANKPSTNWGFDSATIVNKWGSGNRREYNIVYRNFTEPNYGIIADTFEFAVSEDGTDPAGSTRAVSTNASPISTDQWYFIVAWRDTVSGTLNIQVNNGLANSVAFTGSITDTTALFELGRNQGNAGNGGSWLRYSGRVDELGIWNRVLTEEERTALYNSGDGLTYPFDGSLPPTATRTATATQTRTPLPPVNLPFIHGRPLPQWFTIKEDGFEGAFPNDWQVADYDNDNGHYFWAARDCQAASGSRSVWSVGGGDGAGLGCGSNYPDRVSAWMIYGPFSLAEATAAEMTLQVKFNVEPGWDYVCYAASPTDDQYYGTCLTGNSGGWLNRTLNLAALPNYGSVVGDSSVWVALIFDADSTINYPNGAFVDNVLIRQCKYGVCPPAATSLFQPTPGTVSEKPMVLNRP